MVTWGISEDTKGCAYLSANIPGMLQLGVGQNCLAKIIVTWGLRGLKLDRGNENIELNIQKNVAESFFSRSKRCGLFLA